jgi:hypothetical protein
MGYFVGEHKGEFGTVRDASHQSIGEYYLSTLASKGVRGSRLDEGELFGRMVSPSLKVSSNRQEEAHSLLVRDG